MRYKLKNDLGMREIEVLITLEDLSYMNNKLNEDKRTNGFIFGLEKVERT